MSELDFSKHNVAVERRNLGSNPKDAIGSTKVSITKLPMAGIIHGAHGMMDGAEKYNAYNWRENKVIAHIYIDAAMRHMMDWFEGQEQAKDSEVHHLGHAIACCAILLDAQETGNLIDDRPIFGDPDVVDRLLDRLSAIVKRRAQEKAAKKTVEYEAAKSTAKFIGSGGERNDSLQLPTTGILPNFTGYPDENYIREIEKSLDLVAMRATG